MILSTKGAELHYTTRGHGPTCLVLSSIGTKPYECLLPASLTERLRLVYVDLRGSGRSTGEPTDLTFDVLAEDLEAIRVELGVERVAVLGHSILGALAIEYSRRCPESISHVIAVGTPPRGDMALLSTKATAFFEEDASEERKQVLRDSMAKLPPGAPPGQVILAQTALRFFDARFDPAPLFAGAEIKLPVFAHLMGTLAPAWDITVGSSSLRVPIFIAHGRYDYVVPYVLWDGIAPTLPRATLQIFEQSGHQPFFEEPDRFASSLATWMSNNS
jgi:proline iminopeptidase